MSHERLQFRTARNAGNKKKGSAATAAKGPPKVSLKDRNAAKKEALKKGAKPGSKDEELLDDGPPEINDKRDLKGKIEKFVNRISVRGSSSCMQQLE